MKITKVFLACMIGISMSACAELPIVSGGASFSGKDAIRTINVVRNATKIRCQEFTKKLIQASRTFLDIIRTFDRQEAHFGKWNG